MPDLRQGGRPVAATCAAAALIVLLPRDTPPVVVATVVPLLLCGWCGVRAPSRAGLAATILLTVALQVHVGFSEAPNAEIALGTLAPWWLGREVRRRRVLVEQLAARTRELEAAEEAFIQLSVQRERTRIARDLHDIVSHHLAVIVIQAGAGRLADPWQPDVAAGRFAAIRDAGTEALVEAERLLSMLHPDGAAAAPRLASLLRRTEATGARVAVDAGATTLPPDVEDVAYRVVQEALTNAMKHAPGAALDVDVARRDGELAITVRNGLAASSSPIAATGSGFGLAGMRERLEAFGGELDAGLDGDGVFRVVARMPVRGGPRSGVAS